MTQELRKLAEAATQGNWHQTPPSGIYQGRMIVTDERAACIAETHNANAAENAAYIAAANPAAILALLDERDAYQQAADKMAAEYKVERDALQAECAEHKENAMRNARQAVAFRAERDQLQAENERLKAEREKDAFRLVWAMNWMRMSVHDHGFTKHVLERGGTADYSDCATYIDKCTTATQEAAYGIHAKGGQQCG